MKFQSTWVVAIAALCGVAPCHADEPAKDATQRVDLGGGVTLEVVSIPPGEFMMGSTPEEKLWATGIEGGATPGTTRESFEGEQPRLVRVQHGFWLGRTEVSVGQFQRFVEETGFITDAEKPGGETQVFDPEWDGYHLTTNVVHPWKSMAGRSSRDPNCGVPQPRCLSGRVCELQRHAGLLPLADGPRTQSRPAARGLGIPAAHRGGVGVWLPRRQQGEPLFLVGKRA